MSPLRRAAGVLVGLLVAAVALVGVGAPKASAAENEIYCRDWNSGGYCIEFRMISDGTVLTCLRTLEVTGSCDRLINPVSGQRWECVAYNSWRGWCEEFVSPNAPDAPPPPPEPPAPDPDAPSLPVASTPVAASPVGQLAKYVPLGPARIADTRSQVTKPDPRQYARVDLDPYIGPGPSNPLYNSTTAAVLNITAADANAPGYLTAFACDSPRPDTSVVNFQPGTASATHAIVSVGISHEICIYTSATTHLVVDLFGVYSTGDGSLLQPVSPRRLLDSRAAAPTVVPAGTRTVVDVPDDSATAALVNITAASPTETGYVTAWPCDQAQPNVSTVNYSGGEGARADAATVPLPGSRELCLFNSAPTHLLVDLLGTFSTEPGGLAYQAATPTRLLDTRTGTRGWLGTVGRDQTLDFAVPGNGLMAVGNLTAVDAHATGYLTLWSGKEHRPNSSNLNFDDGDTLPNFAPSIIGPAASLSVYSGQTGGQHVLYDLTGWFLRP